MNLISLLKEVFLLNLHISKDTNYHVGETTVFNELPLHIRHGRYTHTLFFFDKTAVSNFLHQLYEVLEYYEEKEYEEAEEYDIPF